jgi:hypothetical protein
MCDEAAMTADEWLYELQRPNARLTPLRILALDALLRMRRKTAREWGALVAPHRNADGTIGDTAPLTQDEVSLLGSLGANDAAVLAGDGIKHLEGMVGTLDEWLADGRTPYGEIAARRARPVPMLPDGEAP